MSTTTRFMCAVAMLDAGCGLIPSQPAAPDVTVGATEDDPDAVASTGGAAGSSSGVDDEPPSAASSSSDDGAPGASTGADAPSSTPGDPVEIDLALGFTPLSLELGDFDGDDAIDLLVTGIDDDGVVTSATLFGAGDGTFAAPVANGLVGCSAYPVVGRLSDDDRDDVILGGCHRTLDAFTSAADGTFAAWAQSPNAGGGVVLRSSIVTDFDDDDDRDVVFLYGTGYAAYTTIGLSIWLSNGGTGFWPSGGASLGPSATSGFDPIALVAGHFDDDRLVDLALTDREHDVARLVGTTPEGFALPLELGVDIAPWSTLAADFDADGLDELLVTSRTDAALQVLANVGDADFEPLPGVELVDLAPSDTVVGDLDGDGDLDVAVVDDEQAIVRWLSGDGAGGLADAQQRALSTPAIRIHAADLDGDDVDDLALATYAAGSITLLLSEPAG